MEQITSSNQTFKTLVSEEKDFDLQARTNDNFRAANRAARSCLHFKQLKSVNFKPVDHSVITVRNFGQKSHDLKTQVMVM